jgi:hypothetical protein
VKALRRVEEWDWPPTRKHYRTSRSQFDIYQPSGWNSPVAKKIIGVYWAVMVTIIKMVFIAALTFMVFGASWLIGVLLGLLISKA